MNLNNIMNDLFSKVNRLDDDTLLEIVKLYRKSFNFSTRQLRDEMLHKVNYIIALINKNEGDNYEKTTNIS